jgi:hypothetical protein
MVDGNRPIPTDTLDVAGCVTLSTEENKMDFEHIGPIQLLVVGFGPDAQFRGAVLDELDDLTSRGLIRVIDLQFAMKTAAGDLIALETTDLTDEETIEFGVVINGLIERGQGGEAGAGTEAAAGAERAYGLSAAEITELAAGLEAGEAVGMLLFEHVWAARLKYALRSTGAYPIAQGFLTPEALFMVGKEVQAIVEAEATIEIADAIKGAAMLDALAAVSAAEEIKAAAAAQALQALIVADFIEDYAAEGALAALVEAGLISEFALAEAERNAVLADQEAQEAIGAINAAVSESA